MRGTVLQMPSRAALPDCFWWGCILKMDCPLKGKVGLKTCGVGNRAFHGRRAELRCWSLQRERSFEGRRPTGTNISKPMRTFVSMTEQAKSSPDAQRGNCIHGDFPVWDLGFKV